jgi:hypothetical protein
MKVFGIAAFFGIIVICLVPASASAQQVNNPIFASWSAYKIGTAVTYEQTRQGADHKIIMDVTETLAEKADDHVTLVTSTTGLLDGAPIPAQAGKQTIKAKLDKIPDKKQVGTESIDVAGQKIDCKIYESTDTDTQGGQVKIKVWTSDDVPGTLVKLEATTSAGTLSMAVKHYEKK